MKKYKWNSLFILTFVLFLYSCSQSDIPVADFEGPDYGAWVATGDAFGTAPLKLDMANPERTFPPQRWIDQNKPKLALIKQGLVNTSVINPQSTGTLTSSKIKVERRYLVFLYTSGEFPDKVGVNILQEEKVIKTLTGSGSAGLDWQYFDLKELKNTEIQIQLTDQVTERNGILQADYFYLSNALPVAEKSIELQLTSKFINLPVRTGDPVKLVKLMVDNKVVNEFRIELADSFPQFYTFIDVEKYKGKKAVLTTPVIEKKSNAFDFITNDDNIKDSEDLYQEKLRQQIHFSAKRGWNNDPNGLVYFDGEYHLFFQHNPYGWAWGNMHWGQAVSKNLVHWSELGEALYPDSLGTMFSGSAVVDWANTAGFSSGDQPAIVCFYTAAGNTSAESKNVKFTQCIAYSTDKGRTWTKYEGNPVLQHVRSDNRDPKVLWYEKGKKWIMALFLDRNDYALFSSTDLKTWERLSDVVIPGDGECPEFFELAVDGNAGNTRWIFYGGKGTYLIGRFDGKNFTTESGPHPNNYGNCFYASQTYSDIPKEDGRRIQIGWGQVASPGMPFNQCMLFPTQLTLKSTREGIRMFTEPVKEIELLHNKEWKKENLTIDPNSNPVSGISGELYHIKADFKPGKNSQVGFKIHGTEVLYDAAKGELTCLNRKAELRPDGGKVRFEIIVDRNTIEIFCNNGKVYMPIARDLTKDYGLELICRNEKVIADNIQIFELNSIWK
jgi:sucrose-6-phosphate hydrolase SacC (GH32 family)